MDEAVNVNVGCPRATRTIQPITKTIVKSLLASAFHCGHVAYKVPRLAGGYFAEA